MRLVLFQNHHCGPESCYLQPLRRFCASLMNWDHRLVDYISCCDLASLVSGTLYCSKTQIYMSSQYVQASYISYILCLIWPQCAEEHALTVYVEPLGKCPVIHQSLNFEHPYVFEADY